METDPLQQLRDIHLPMDPSWWPPAFGWWIVALLVIGLLAWLLTTLRTAWRKRAPIRAARKIYAQLHKQAEHSEIVAPVFAHQCNELLKRLMVHGLGETHLAPRVDRDWLAALDEVTGNDTFSKGAGQILGVQRFSTAPEVDIAGLHQAMSQFLKAVKP